MIQPWPEIAAYFSEEPVQRVPQPMREAFAGIESLARYIAGGPLATHLYGSTSMYDLCIQQTPTRPDKSPHLRISATKSGLVEFRYVDTAIEKRQWHRMETADRVIVRLDHFLDQLHWIARPSSPIHESKPNV
jgi:hypothetical protein